MGIRNLFLKADWKALAFCVLAASTFWFLNAMNQDYTDEISYPFRIEYNPEEVVPLEKLPRRIRLNVSGYGWNIFNRSLGVKSPPIIYKPENLPGKKYATSAELLALVQSRLSGVKLNFIVTDTIYFHFDKLSVKKVKVKADSSEISLANSHKITSPIVIVPDTLLYKGPASLLERIPDTLVLKIQKEGINEDFESKIKIPELGTDHRVKLLNKEVRVRFNVSRLLRENMEVSLIPAHFPNDTLNYYYDSRVILTYFVREEDKNKIDSNDFAVYLDYRKIDRSDSTIKPTVVKKPSFIQDIYITPYAIKVRTSQ